MNARNLHNGRWQEVDGVYTVAMAIPTGVPEDSSLYSMNQSTTTRPYVYAKGEVTTRQPVGRQPRFCD